ncbi:MAG: helix-turn-helix domain protein [Bacteriophage sp.]|nr:MAG: helix-turn-helix domain protein [Bacteriophage sp.]DAX14013.1 MAG TPA: helix-turn-helix domain protein [Bacteriophage sp.]
MSRINFEKIEIILLTVRNFYIIINHERRKSIMTFGEKIKQARTAKKLTQKQLAEKINVKHNSISDWEKDKCKPDMDTIELLCGALEVTPTYLVGSKSDDDYATIIGNLMSEPDVLDFIEEYKALDKEDKKAIKQIVSSLNKKSKG